jgi:hypothetical protein
MFLPAPGKMLKEKLFQAIGFCIVKIQRNRYQWIERNQYKNVTGNMEFW